MTDRTAQPWDNLPPDVLECVDALCERFEAAWKSGTPPALPEYLAAVSTRGRTALLGELLALERVYRRRRDEAPAAEDYARLLPEVATLVRRLWAQAEGACDCEAVNSTLITPPAVAWSLLRPEVPGYEVLGELGRGGMGVVFKARQIRLNRMVALKMIAGPAQAGWKAQERIRAEAEVVARLRHPNIIQIYEVGEEHGLPYLALEFVEDGSLADRLDGSPWPMREAARLVEQLAGAVHHAHQAGIVHRDLKPANLLLSFSRDSESAGATLPSGSRLNRCVPKITDFGLAKLLEAEAGQTRTGDVFGTPRYMAPEQAAGRNKDVGPATDVHALGILLYELLTGRPPFQGATVLATLEQVRRQEPVPPRRLQPRLARDLQTICLKCLQKEPARRYQSAAALAEDLRRWQAGEPIRARRVGAAEHGWRWCRRNPALAGALAAVVLLFWVAFAGITSNYVKAEAARQNADSARQDEARQRTAADEARSREAGQREQAEQTLYYSNIARAQLEYRALNIADAEDILDRCPEARRGWEWRYLKQLCHADLLTLPRDNQPGHTGWVYAVAYSPDGKWLALGGGGNPFWETAGTGGMRPGEVILWDAATGTPIRTLRGHKNVVSSVAFSPDGRQIAGASPKDSVRVWESATGRLLRVFPEGWSVAFSPDGKWLATGNTKETVQLWDLAADLAAEPVPIATLVAGVNGSVSGVAFSPDSRRLAGAIINGGIGEVKVWNIPAGTEAMALQSNTGPVSRVQFSPDGRYLAADLGGKADASLIRLWDAATGQLVQSLAGHRGQIPGLAFDPTGERVASAGADGTVRVWAVPGGQETRRYRGHREMAQAVAFSPDGMRLASASADGTLKVWDLTLDPETADVPGGEATYGLEALAFVGDGQQLLLARRGGLLRTLDCGSRAEVGSVRQVPLTAKWMTPAEPAALDPGGHWLAGISGDDPRVARCWDARTGAERATLRGHTLDLLFVTVSSGGQVATAGCSARGEPARSEVKVWDGATGRPLLELDERDFVANRVALSPQGDRLAVCGVQVLPPAGGKGNPHVEAVVRVYDVATGQVVRSFSGGDDPLPALAFSPDGARLAAAGALRRTVLLWDLAAERPTVTHQGPEWAMDLAFSPDGRRVAVASRRMVKLLDAASGEQMLILRGFAHLHPDTNGFNPRVRFSPDGRRIAAICHDSANPVSIWSVEEAGSDPAGRQRAADLRSLATHLEQAKAALRDAKRQATFRFHLKWLGEAELTSAADLAARGALYARDGQSDRATADFTRATQLAPDDEAVWYECGAGWAAVGRWEQALPYFARFADLGRGTDRQWYNITVLSLYLNDREAYRRRCQKMLDLFGRSADPTFVSLLLIWGPLAGDSGVDLGLLLRQVDHGLADNENRTRNCSMMQAKGMAEYRAGRMEQAVEWLHKAEALLHAAGADHDASKIINFFFLSMAYQRLNRAEAAKAKYQEGLRQMEKTFGGLDQYQPGKGWDWYDWPWCQLVRREAEGLINGRAAAPKK
jgi:eukaryotic-like serine/threonine-protein kinase